MKHTAFYGQWVSFLCFLVTRRAMGLNDVHRNLQDAKVKIDLEPFQVVYITNTKGVKMDREYDIYGNLSFDKMTLLSITRAHLVDNEFSKHDNFLSLTLFQTIRSVDEMFANGTHVAFTGSAYYSEAGMTQDQMIDLEYMCFLGDSEHVYVNSLREEGWVNLERAQLMTVGGDMVIMEDGDMVMVDMTSNESLDSMDQGISTIMYFVAVLVPVLVVVLAMICCVLYLAKNNVSCRRLPDPADAQWQASPAKARQLRRMTLTIKNGDDTSSAASEITDHSTKATVSKQRKVRDIPSSSPITSSKRIGRFTNGPDI